MTFEEYSKAIGVSNSMLKDIAEPDGCPALYHARHVAKTCEQEETRALLFGGLYHKALLEPDTIESACYVRPDGPEGNFRTKAGEAWRDAHTDRPIITREEWQAMMAMRDAVYRNRKARLLLTGAQIEVSRFADDKSGIRRKCRVDALPVKAPNAIADLKTMRSVHRDEFDRESTKRRYYVQGAYYLGIDNLLGGERDAFAFICQEKTPPYLVAVHELGPLEIEVGRKVYERDLAVLAHCMETGEWPGPKEHIGGLTRWEMERLQREKII